jgi:nitroreductase
MKDCSAMELHEAIRRRAMVRSFSEEPVDEAVITRILLDALRSPTAGNCQGTAWVVLEGPEQTGVYFDATTDEEWRRGSSRWDGLRRAPVILLAYSSSDMYLDRYRSPDKSGSGLGEDVDLWPVPYWTGDAAFGVMTTLLDAVDAGLGACILGTFRGEERLNAQLGVPPGWRLFCAVALGHPDGRDHRSASLSMPRLPASQRVHRGRWG